jgi:hypothetical protein
MPGIKLPPPSNDIYLDDDSAEAGEPLPPLLRHFLRSWLHLPVAASLLSAAHSQRLTLGRWGCPRRALRQSAQCQKAMLAREQDTASRVCWIDHHTAH